MNYKIKMLLIALMLSGVVSSAFSEVYSTYYYSASAQGGERKNGEYIAKSKSSEGVGSGILSGRHEATGWREFPSMTGARNYMTSPGDGHSVVNYRIDSDAGELHGYLFSDADHVDDNLGQAMAQSTLEMGCRQYYRAEGTEPLTVRLNFHYDGTIRGNWLARVNLCSYVTKVLNEKTYFAEFEKGLYLWMLDLPASVDLYDNRWGEKQTIAETFQVFQTDNFGGGMGDDADEQVELEFTVIPGELFVVDTMFSAYVTVNAQTQDSDGKIDFSNTASSTVELISGDGSLSKIAMPDSIQPFECTYAITNNEVMITGYRGTRTSVQIPDTIDGHPVTLIASEAFMNCKDLVSVVIPASVTNIGESAFFNCSSLTSIVIPTNITTIGDSTFSACTSLTDVVIPDLVTSIKEYAFAECYRLSDISIPVAVTNLGEGAFSSCVDLTRLAIPDGVITLGEAAFYSCTNLTSITIPSSVTTMASYAFVECSNLSSVYCKGDAPTQGEELFDKSLNVTVYHLPGTEGWDATYGNRPVVLWNPRVQTGDTNFGVQDNGFGFNITHTNDLTVVVEGSESLTNLYWTPLGIHTLNAGAAYFSDTGWTNRPARYYRLRMP